MPVAAHIHFGEELLDRDRGVCRAGRAEDIESVLRPRQLGIDHGLAADLAKSGREAAGLFDRNQRVVGAV